MGADIALDVTATTADERRALVLEATGGRGPDVGVEAAGSPRAVEEGLTLVRDGGRYVSAGHYTNAGPSAINAHDRSTASILRSAAAGAAKPVISSGR